jgi:hypothetical protein
MFPIANNREYFRAKQGKRGKITGKTVRAGCAIDAAVEWDSRNLKSGVRSPLDGLTVLGLIRGSGPDDVAKRAGRRSCKSIAEHP